MATFSAQLEEIKSIFSSNVDYRKPFAYSTLLHLQELSGSSSDPSQIQSLADSSRSLLSPIPNDIASDDEEIAAQALKCLGFMIYHPVLVAVISGNDANAIVDSLTKVIISTKMKAICNLGVWCISVQQFDALVLAPNFHSILRAVVHSLDNPIGSLSTTFEAMQAVIKLANQLKEKMRDTSNIWVPPVYRRLISTDKREREMSERCLLKIRSMICPPPIALSKVLVIDMKKKLLPGMKELLNYGLKIQAIQAWGWFIRLLGPYAAKSRHIVNEMLKIPEHTFCDVDSQVQIASLAAWEGLIDALIQPPTGSSQTSMVAHGIDQEKTCEGTDSRKGDGFSKSARLIVTPIIGIMSSKCDVSVHSSCLNTWSYFLHKLDDSVNCPPVITNVWEPIFDVVFRVGPDRKSILLWNICLDLLDDFILAKTRDSSDGTMNQVKYNAFPETSATKTLAIGKCSLNNFPIKWLPWDLHKLDFCIKIIRALITKGSTVNLSGEFKSSAFAAALRVFRSVLKAVDNVLKNSSLNYDQVILCLHTILGLLKDIGEQQEAIINEPPASLQFIEAVIEEFKPSILGSSLYQVALDLRCSNNLQSVPKTKHEELLGVQFAGYMDQVSPIVYLTNIYFCGLFETMSPPSKVIQEVCRYLKLVFTSFEPSGIIHAVIGLLYKHVGFDYLKMWIAVTNSVKDYICEAKDISLLKLDSDSWVCLAVCHLLSYPFVVYSYPPKRLTNEHKFERHEPPIISTESQIKVELVHVIEVWKSLYVCITRASQVRCADPHCFADHLSSVLSESLDETTKGIDSAPGIPRNNAQEPDLLFLCENAVVCILETILASKKSYCRNRNLGDCESSIGISNSLGFAARFMMLSCKFCETNPPTRLDTVSRVFSALVDFVGSLHLKEDIVTFMKIMSNPLLLWFPLTERACKDMTNQLQLLWTTVLDSLQKSHPSVVYDSSFLQFQAPLLERTLSHLNPTISEPTITFWNSTYAMEAVKLDYPQNLIPILDKLTRSGRINHLPKRSLLPPIRKCNSKEDATIACPQRYRVATAATQNRSSKRVELMENKVADNSKFVQPKRKRQELTEHQKEVRRAQQGRERDCNGHGPGVRTYTAADFSQGNEESQDSQEDIRNAESILEMFRRAS